MDENKPERTKTCCENNFSKMKYFQLTLKSGRDVGWLDVR